jgi:hypothetical protein
LLPDRREVANQIATSSLAIPSLSAVDASSLHKTAQLFRTFGENRFSDLSQFTPPAPPKV